MDFGSIALAALGSAGSAGLKGGMDFLSANYARKHNAKSARKQAQMLMDYQLKLDQGPYFKLAQDYNEANYDLAERYARNSASWAVDSLRQAGLNPILAASQGFNAQTGVQGVEMHAPSPSSPSFNNASSFPSIDFNESVRDISSAQLMHSSVDKQKAEIESIRANTLDTLVNAINSAENGGSGGMFGTIWKAFTEMSGDSSSSAPQSDLLHKYLWSYYGIDSNSHVGRKMNELQNILNPGVAHDIVNSAQKQATVLKELTSSAKEIASDLKKDVISKGSQFKRELKEGIDKKLDQYSTKFGERAARWFMYRK